MRLPIVSACAALLVALPLSAQDKVKRYVAPSDATIFTEIEEGYGTTPLRIVYVYNHSSVPVTIYSMSLRDCSNIKQECTPRKLNLKVKPGSRSQLARVEPKNPYMSTRFGISFGWRADSAALKALQLMAEAGDDRAREQLATRAAAEEDRRAMAGSGDLLLDDDAIKSLGNSIVGIRVEPDSVLLPVGGQLIVRRVRVIAVDGSGEPLGRVGALRWRYPGGILRHSGDTVSAMQAGRSTVEFTTTTTATPFSAVLRVIAVADSSGK